MLKKIERGTIFALLVLAVGAPSVQASICNGPDFVQYVDKGDLKIPFYFRFEEGDTSHQNVLVCLENTKTEPLRVEGTGITSMPLDPGKKQVVFTKTHVVKADSADIKVSLGQSTYGCTIRKSKLLHGWHGTHGWFSECKKTS